MRSLFSFGASKEMSLAVAGSGHRPEMLRRKTLATNARIAIVASAVLMLPAIISLVMGMALPFVIAAMGLGVGMISLAMHQRGEFDQAAAVQVYAIMAIGLILTLADRQFAD